MDKEQVAQILVEIGTLLELKGENPFMTRDDGPAPTMSLAKSSGLRFALTKFLFVLALLSSLPLFAANETNQAAPVSLENYLQKLGYAPIPLKRSHNDQPVVQARIENKTRTLLVDSGWTFTTLDRSVARGAKTLADLGVTLEDSFLGAITNENVTLLPDMQLGKVTFTNQPAVLWNVSYGPSSRWDGVLGCDFLCRNYCLLDCCHLNLFVRGGKLPANFKQILEQSLERSGYRKIALKRLRALGLTCQVEVNGEPVNLLVDTGDFWTVLDTSVEDRCHLFGLGTFFELVGAGGRKANLRRASYESVAFDGVPISKASKFFGVARLGAWNIGEKQGTRFEADGLMGNELLLISQAIIDFDGQCMWVVPDQPKKK